MNLKCTRMILMGYMNHTIIYKPHCSECGVKLSGEVLYDKGLVFPNRCPNCGVAFETIVIPSGLSNVKFSFNANEYTETSRGGVYIDRVRIKRRCL